MGTIERGNADYIETTTVVSLSAIAPSAVIALDGATSFRIRYRANAGVTVQYTVDGVTGAQPIVPGQWSAEQLVKRSLSVLLAAGAAALVEVQLFTPATLTASQVEAVAASFGAYIGFAGGSAGDDVTADFIAACDTANAEGVPLLLPPWPILVSQTFVVDKMIGTPGKSKIILAPDFTKTGFGTQFCWLNSSFQQFYDDDTASEIFYEGFDVETTPNAARSILGLANVKRGRIERVNITANQVIGGNGKPIVVDALIDCYAVVKNVDAAHLKLQQLTGAYGSSKVAAGGGGCLWIRNLRSAGGTATDNVTENVHFRDIEFVHTTSDEAAAIYGVRGPTRNCSITQFRATSPQPAGGPYHVVLMSIFPLDDGSGAGLGNTAEVSSCRIADGVIEDRAYLYNVLKIGNSADASRLCFANTFENLKIRGYRSSDGANGPRAVWVAAGAPGTDPDPGSKLVRCIEGTAGTAFDGANSGNRCVNVQAHEIGGGSQCNAAFSGWQALDGCTSRGDVYSGAESCRTIDGGEYEAFGRAFYNVNQITGAFAQVNGSGNSAYCVNYIDSGSAQSYAMTSVRFVSAGGWVNLTNSVPASSLLVTGCQGTMNNAAAAAVVNNANASAVVLLVGNRVGGTMSAAVSGSGTTTHVGQGNWINGALT